MQSQEPQQFRFTPQWAVIVLITLLALIIPVACVVVALKDIFRPQPEETVSSAPLQMALEGIADKNLAPPPLAGSDQKIELTAQDPVKEGEQIAKLATAYHGVALPGVPDGEKTRLLIQLPVSLVPSFIASCRQPEHEVRIGAIVRNDEARVLVEVVIAKKSP